MYKQQYLELLEKQEYQKAFTYLTKRLKPLEAYQSCKLLLSVRVYPSLSFSISDFVSIIVSVSV